MSDPKTRTLEALTLAELAEAVAALVLEVKPKGPGARR